MTTITELRQLHQQATPRPWKATTACDVIQAEKGGLLAESYGEANTVLIAAMRNALPALLDIAEAAKTIGDLTNVVFEIQDEHMSTLRQALARLEELNGNDR